MGKHKPRAIGNEAAGERNLRDLMSAMSTALEAIRDMALSALTQIDQSQETRSMRWGCKH